MTAQHGILRPNPVLFDLEKRKKKPLLGHELGEGKISIIPSDPMFCMLIIFQNLLFSSYRTYFIKTLMNFAQYIEVLTFL